MTEIDTGLPPITVRADDFERLQRLARAAADKFPQAADMLAREMARAAVANGASDIAGVVTMGSEVEFKDESTGQVRRITLVYPEEADVSAGRISVLTPIGAALIGLSVGQSMAWDTPSGERRVLSVRRVSAPEA